MSLLQLKNVSISFGAQAILDHSDLIIEPNERIGLIGRNGAGKSTLLKLISGEIEVDDGDVKRQQGLVIGRLIQEVPNTLEQSVQAVIAAGNSDVGTLLTRHYEGDQSEALQVELNQRDAWSLDRRIQTLCSKFNLTTTEPFNTLSGGLRRRVLLAQALLNEPDILLLDEPTNHSDIDSILWLETMLTNLDITIVLVSHDRAFIDALCTRIIELDRGQLTSWRGNYANYLRNKAKALEEEQRHHAAFDKKLAQEEAWIRQGIKARRTRNEGRVRALKKLREERKQRREQQGNASFNLNQSNKSGKLVVEAKQIQHSYSSTTIIDDFSCRIQRGDKVGIIGPNGCGKSTLIKIFTGELAPDDGQIRLGSQLQTAYLDQHRSSIQDHLSVQDNVAEGASEITVNGHSKHIMSYLQDFLFSPERARAPAAKLSGGERNRVMLAKLFTQPFNLLVLDEPTNDLDYETLELLEQLLMDYSGTLLLVSHDRAFLNNVVTSTIAFEGNGMVREYVGGYDDWVKQRPAQQGKTMEKASTNKQNNQKDTTKKTNIATSKTRKLSYHLQRELDQLPVKIDELENQIEQLQTLMSQTDFYQGDPDTIAAKGNELKTLEQQLEACFSRWEELEG